MNIVQETVKFLDGPFKETLGEESKIYKFLQKNEAAMELYTYCEDDAEYVQKALYVKLQKKMSAGKYEHLDAVKEWEKKVKSITKDPDMDFDKSWYKKPVVIQAVARLLADQCRDELKALEKSGKSASTIF